MTLHRPDGSPIVDEDSLMTMGPEPEDWPAIEDLEGPRCIECGVLSDARLCTRCYCWDKT